MKKERLSNPVIDYTPKKVKLTEPTLAPRTCMVCKHLTQGYGSYSEGYTCSRKCTDEYEKNRPSLIDYVTRSTT